MAYLDVRDTNTEDIFQKKKKLVSILDKIALRWDNNFDQIKYWQFFPENVYTEYFVANYTNIKEILRKKKNARFNFGRKCLAKEFCVRNKISLFLFEKFCIAYLEVPNTNRKDIL